MKNIINKIKYWLKPEVPKEILNLLNEKLIPTNIIKIRKFVYKTEILTNKPLNVGDILWEVSDFNTYIISDRENNIYEIKVYGSSDELPEFFLRIPSTWVLSKYRF